MKKLKLFISLWFTMFSMVVFGQAEYEKIAITANTQDNSALKVNVQSSSNEINWKYIKDFQKEKEYLSTGLIKSGVISINGDNTKYNVSAGIGIITNFDDPENPTSTIVNFPAVVAKTPSYLTTSNITYVAINSSGTVTESATPFTPEQRRTLIILGAVIHSNLTNINVVNNISAPTNASTNQLHDLMEAIGALNLSGNKFGPNNSNLLMNKSAGTIFKLGSNFVNDWKNPHVLGQSALTGLTFRYRTQNGTEGSDLTSITPNVYDLNNVLTSVPSNRYSIQTITLFQTGLVRIQYGQETYGSLSEAEAAISTRSYNVESNIALNGITRAYLLVKEGTTSLANTADAKFVDAGKFGSITSGGGAITLAAIVAALGYTPENNANKQNSLATDGSGVKYPTVDAVNTKVSNIDNTSDLNKPISTATQTALNLKENTANKNIANGYAGLGSDGKLISSQLPSITITDTFVVGSQSAMLSLVAETGDVAVRTDVNKSFILQGDTPSDLADWQELLTPTSTVTSVFGRTGAVTSNSGDYTADQISETASRKFQTLAQQTYNDATSSIQTQLNGKVSLSATETIGGVKTFSNMPILGAATSVNGQIVYADASNQLKTTTNFKYNDATGVVTTLLGNLGSNAYTSTAYQPLLTNPVVASTFTANYIPKFTGSGTTIGQSQIFDNGSFVGIGVSSGLNRTLQIVGSTQISHKQTNSPFEMLMGQFDDSGNAAINNVANANLYFHTNNQRVMTLLANKNVGIDVNTPTEKLQVNGNIKLSASNSFLYGGDNAGRLIVTNNDVTTYFGIYGSSHPTAPNTFSLVANNIPALTIPNTGNIGIGTNTPLNKLDVAGNISLSSGGANVFRVLQSVQAAGYNGPGFYSQSDLGYGVASGGTHRFIGIDGNTEMMRITSGGDVGVGVVPKTWFNSRKAIELFNGGAIVGVNAGWIENWGNSYIDSSASTRYLQNGFASLYQYGNVTNGGHVWFSSASGTAGAVVTLNQVMTLNGSGALNVSNLGTGLLYTNGGTLTSTNPSDGRLKNNITDLGYGLSDILKLRPVSYNWKDDKINQGKQFGFIAQEVQEVMPELVKEFKTEEGNRLGLDKEGIYAALVNAIKEQQAQIKELQKEMEILKNK